MGKQLAPLGFAVVGGFIGGLFTAGSFSTLGASIGYSLGAAVTAPGQDGSTGGGAPTIEGSAYDIAIPEFAGIVGNVQGNIITVAKNDAGEDAGIIVVTQKKKSGGKGGGTVTEESYFLVAEFLIGRALGGTLFSPEPLFVDKIEIEEGGERRCIYDRDGATSDERGFELVQQVSDLTGRVISETSEVLRLYTGTDEQMPDSALLEFYPDGLCAHRGCAKVVFNRLPIKSQPSFYFTVRSVTTGRRALISQRLQNVGIPAGRLDLDAIDEDSELKGKQVTSLITAQEFCEKIARPLYCDFAFDGARIIATSRLVPTVHEVQPNELGAWNAAGDESGGSDDGRLVLRARAQEEMCSEAKVSFWDQNNSYEASSGHAPQARARHSNSLEYDQGEVSNLQDATHLARAIRDEDWLQDEEARFRVLGGHDTWLCGDVARLPRGLAADGTPVGERDYLLMEIERQEGGILECLGMPWAAHVYEQSGLINGPLRPTPHVLTFDAPILLAIDTVALSERDPDTVSAPGLLVATSQRSIRAYEGVTIRVGTSSSAAKFASRQTRERAVIGELTADFDPNSDTSFTCKTLYGELASASLSATGLRNLIAFDGGLLLSFDVATIDDYDPDEDWIFYTISTLRSGRFGSEYAIQVLPSGTRFVSLRDFEGDTMPGVEWFELGSGQIGSTVRVSALSDGTVGYDPTSTQDILFNARNMEELPPVVTSTARGAFGNLNLVGRCRTRYALDNYEYTSARHRMSARQFPQGYKYRIELNGGAKSFDLFTTDDRASFNFTISSADLGDLAGQDISGTIAIYGQYGPGRTISFEAPV